MPAIDLGAILAALDLPAPSPALSAAKVTPDDRLRQDIGRLEAERDRLRRDLAFVRETLASCEKLRQLLRERLARYEGGAGFDAWAVGQACGEWFAGLGRGDSRFGLLEID